MSAGLEFKPTVVRIKHHSADRREKETRIITFTNYKETQPRRVVREPDEQTLQELGDRILVIREARRNRTLRSILL